MTHSPTLRAGRVLLWTATSLGMVACSSPATVGAADATTDTPLRPHQDAGDSATEHRDGTTSDSGVDAKPEATVEAGFDASDASVREDGKSSKGDSSTVADAHTKDARDAKDAKEVSDAHDATTADATDAADATEDAEDAEGPPDAPVDTGPGDAGPPVLRIIGRTLTDGTSPGGAGTGSCTASSPCYEWSGTQVVARFTGATGISYTMSDWGSYFDVYVDGTLQSASPVIGSGSQSSYVIASGLDPSATHEVSLYKRTEASSNGRTQLQGYSFPGGIGTLLPPAAAATRRIEVIGDSMSCGYGVLGSSASCTADSSNEDHDDSYGAITARTLGADLFTIASSGRGVYRNNDGSTTGTLPDVYGLALPYGSGPGGLWTSTWDFASWTPDAVVIDLGTNDYAEGNPTPGAEFETTYFTFLQAIRHNYKDAYILCTNGPMLSGTDYSAAGAYIQQAVTAMSDPKVAFLAFPTQSPANEGCEYHPNVTEQQIMAAQLTTALQTALGW
jgi:lysophospholipase L1-like esterase